ncbi:MAG: GNAT family N-acetyltransferase [Pseudonocardiaceae bacterium]|nr:GNAT family N-acetyltransferase [Pseudonocardiaceae bacterium]
MSAQPTVRSARYDELDAVGELTVQAYLADGRMDRADPYVTQLRDAAGRARDAELLVAADDTDRLLGTVTVCEPGSPLHEVSQPGELEFRMLAVTPAARGRGIGGLLTRAVLDRAAQRGARRVVLSSSEWMHAAHRLYTRLGFSRLPERDWRPVPGLQLIAFGLAPGQLTGSGESSTPEQCVRESGWLTGRDQ